MKNTIQGTQASIDAIVGPEVRGFTMPVVTVLKARGYDVRRVGHSLIRPCVQGLDSRLLFMGQIYINSKDDDCVFNIPEISELKQYDFTPSLAELTQESAVLYGQVPGAKDRLIQIIIQAKEFAGARK